MCILIRPTQTA